MRRLWLKNWIVWTSNTIWDPLPTSSFNWIEKDLKKKNPDFRKSSKPCAFPRHHHPPYSAMLRADSKFIQIPTKTIMKIRKNMLNILDTAIIYFIAQSILPKMTTKSCWCYLSLSLREKKGRSFLIEHFPKMYALFMCIFGYIDFKNISVSYGISAVA
jgi:hypothetical protein